MCNFSDGSEGSQGANMTAHTNLENFLFESFFLIIFFYIFYIEERGEILICLVKMSAEADAIEKRRHNPDQ